uniref:Reverse transcriptase domain-containing protein n=1 Tax=Astyanax mexicanus TaxID=7994 RepID=A0A3B1ID19_ASTMX
MPNNKAPGPDRFPVEFYKHFWPSLSPLFNRMISEIKQNAKLPTNMNTAIISLHLKPNKDPTLPSSYRPLSLMNTDTKIISKALANRIQTVIHNLIHPDQTGFLQVRHSSTNMRRLLNIIDYTTHQKIPTAVVTLDAEKAFDRVNWKFLFTTLHKLGFGESFINWIKILYTAPKATVNTNGVISQPFTLHRGTRQGCSLSPYLFSFFIEPLAATIQQNTNIKGIKTPSMEHKISLYADDILLFLQKPDISIAETIQTIENYSKISDYSINWSKSTVLPINMNRLDDKFKTIPIPMCTNYITYLGVRVSPQLSELFKLNFNPLTKTISDDLNRWTTLPISLIGRIATIKMSVLTKINYLFSMIPTQPPNIWFQSLNTSLTQFYWKNKPPRIKLYGI